jgi:hypothetical protein
MALAIVRGVHGQSGAVTVHARAAGLQGASINLATSPATSAPRNR